jgi:hypothetical protein
VSFQAYLDNIRAKTATATQLVTWLRDEFDLGRGHSIALWAVCKRRGWVDAPARRKTAR